jgi:mono/diheme cytochrome c family protein
MIIRAAAVFGSAIPVVVLASDPTSAWDGVYRADQAAFGGMIYPSVCGRCHGYRLDGAPDDPDMFPTPPIAGTKFLRNWNGRSLAALFEYTRTTMPENNPGFLSDQEFIAIVAYMLSMSELPSGSVALPVEVAVLSGIVIEPQP